MLIVIVLLALISVFLLSVTILPPILIKKHEKSSKTYHLQLMLYKATIAQFYNVTLFLLMPLAIIALMMLFEISNTTIVSECMTTLWMLHGPIDIFLIM